MAGYGKAIYRPKGKAGEYSEWACNFYTGCSNNCDYCYCKRGVLASTWSDTPRLKKCFRDENDALHVFDRELLDNLPELRRKGIFFTFTSDPMLEQTRKLTVTAIMSALGCGVPVQLLTKRADLDLLALVAKALSQDERGNLAVGFTLTGHDGLEPGASSNADRIVAMRKFKSMGCRTFASIEPVETLEASGRCIGECLGFCDLFKVGLMSGGSRPGRDELAAFVDAWNARFCELGAKVYWKDSVRRYLGGSVQYPAGCCVGPDYSIFSGREGGGRE